MRSVFESDLLGLLRLVFSIRTCITVVACFCLHVAEAIGPDWRLMRQALLVSFPGAKEQQWHVDGGHISSTRHLPCHAMNVFIALDVRIFERMPAGWS